MNYAEQYQAGKHVREMNFEGATRDELEALLDVLDDMRVQLDGVIDKVETTGEQKDADWVVGTRHKQRRMGQEKQFVQRRLGAIKRSEESAAEKAEGRRRALERAVRELLAEDTAEQVLDLATEYERQRDLLAEGDRR